MSINLGKITIYGKATRIMKRGHKEINKILTRFTNGDFGKISQSDKESNEKAIENNNQKIIGCYKTSVGKLFVITECRKNQTSVILCKECKNNI